MVVGSKYSLTVMCPETVTSMTSTLRILMSLPSFLACSTADGRLVLEFLGTWGEIESVLSTPEFMAVTEASEECLIDCLMVRSAVPLTPVAGTGNQN